MLEQQTTYNATNFSLTSLRRHRTTRSPRPASPRSGARATTGIATPHATTAFGPSGRAVWGTSYSAVTGPWEWDEFYLVPGTLDQLMPGEAQRIAQLGLIYPLSSVRLAEVTDGLSNTLLFGETDYTTWYTRWTVGDGYDTLVGTTAPPNVNMPVLPGWQPTECDSLHPGGVNCTFGDGSVKFIKNSIDSWPFDPNLRMEPQPGLERRLPKWSPTSSPARRSASGRRCRRAVAVNASAGISTDLSCRVSASVATPTTERSMIRLQSTVHRKT